MGLRTRLVRPRRFCSWWTIVASASRSVRHSRAFSADCTSFFRFPIRAISLIPSKSGEGGERTFEAEHEQGLGQDVSKT